MLNFQIYSLISRDEHKDYVISEMFTALLGFLAVEQSFSSLFLSSNINHKLKKAIPLAFKYIFQKEEK